MVAGDQMRRLLVCEHDLVPRLGVHVVPLIGLALATAGMIVLTQLPTHGRYASDVLPGVPVGRPGLPAGRGVQGLGEAVDLHAAVVDVVLAGHVRAVGLQEGEPFLLRS